MPQMLTDYLLNAAWQTPIVAACALLVARFASFGPRARHRAWLAFLAAAVVLPALSLDAVLPKATPVITRTPPSELVGAATPAATQPETLAIPQLSLDPKLAWAMAALAALAAAVAILRLTLAALAARRLVREAIPAQLPAEASQAMAALAARHGRRAPRVLASSALASPAVVGAIRPAILVPEDLPLDGEEARAALLHETAHVLRHDYVANLVCEALSLPLAWHPAMAGLKAGVRRSRELACDAMAAAALGSEADYARRLVALARRLGQTAHAPACDPAQTALAVGLFGRSDLEDRLMHLMKTRDAEAPLLRAARLSGLTAMGVGLLGSAALLHVTPVFAQAAAPPPAPVAAAPLPPAAASATAQASADAAKPAPTPRRHHRQMMFSDHGVLVTSGDQTYAHSWKGADGRTVTVYSDSSTEPTAEEQRRWEDEAAKAEAKAAEVEKKVNSPEFRARIAEATAKAVEARKLVDSPEFKAKIAAAQARAAEAAKMVNSPEFKARIAAAQARAADAERMVNSPEFRARIARAQTAAREAAERLQRELDDIDARDAKAAP